MREHSIRYAPGPRPLPTACPRCAAPLSHVNTVVVGTAPQRDQWDYLQCEQACGTLEYRHRTRALTWIDEAPAVRPPVKEPSRAVAPLTAEERARRAAMLHELDLIAAQLMPPPQETTDMLVRPPGRPKTHTPLGRFVRTRLVKQRLTQSQVAKALRVDKMTLSRLLHGSNPKPETLQKLADYFGVPVEELVALVAQNRTADAGTAVPSAAVKPPEPPRLQIHNPPTPPPRLPTPPPKSAKGVRDAVYTAVVKSQELQAALLALLWRIDANEP